MFFLHPKKVSLSKEERKTSAIVALTATGAFLVFIGGLIGLVRWLMPGPHEAWMVDFTTHPVGIVIIMLCGSLLAFVPELLTYWRGLKIYKSRGAVILAVSSFALGLLILVLGYKELLVLKMPIVTIVAAILTSLLATQSPYQLAKQQKGKLPPPPRSHQSHH